MISTIPDLSKYERDQTFVETIEKAWESQIYGMSILQPIRKPAMEEAIVVPNVLS